MRSTATKITAYTLFILLSGLLCSCHPSLNLHKINSSTFVSFQNKDATIVRDGYKMIQSFDPSTYVRRVYIQRNSDKNPVLFFTHKRQIEATLGHQGRLVLINDYFATKASKVMVADLKSGKTWQIDTAARKQYVRTAAKNWQPNYAIPKAVAFSPNDKMVLITMNSGYIASSAEQAGKFAKRFNLWSYVVDCQKGTVLHTYQTNGFVPHRWWQF